jgi:integrase
MLEVPDTLQILRDPVIIHPGKRHRSPCALNAKNGFLPKHANAFAPRFTEAIDTQCADKPATVGFYKEKLGNLLDYKPFPRAKLDEIDEAMIDEFKNERSKQVSRRKMPLSPASVNRELATLRRLLRMAQEWKVIDRVPRIRLLGGKRCREFVLSQEQEPVYLAACPQPLRDIALLMIDSGLRMGEALSLEWPDVRTEPVNGAKYGYLTVRAGKSKNSKGRNMPLSERVQEMLKRANLPRPASCSIAAKVRRSFRHP